jgi:hypothetical protein
VFNATSGGASSRQQKTRKIDCPKETLANVAKRQEHQDSVDDRDAKRQKNDKARSEAAASRVKSASQSAASPSKFEACKLCGVRRIGGIAQCVYNPQSPQYNTEFGEECRAKAFGGATQPSQFRQSVFRRVDSSAS